MDGYIYQKFSLPGSNWANLTTKKEIAPGDFREKTKNWNSVFDKISIL